MSIENEIESERRISIVENSSEPLFPFDIWNIRFMNRIENVNERISGRRNRTIGYNGDIREVTEGSRCLKYLALISACFI